MWFYQDTEAKGKSLIWFHGLQVAVRRALHVTKSRPDAPVSWVDLGPSGNKNVSELKERYGFKSTVEWGSELCASYNGEFRDVPLYTDIAE